MTHRSRLGIHTSALKKQIRVLEHRMDEHRDAIGTTAEQLKLDLRNQLTAPVTLVTAGLVGVAIHRGQYMDKSGILPILHATHPGLQFILSATPAASEPTEQAATLS